MTTAMPTTELPDIRPTRLIAEALVLRKDAQQVKRQAAAAGLPSQLTDVVLKVCFRSETSSSAGTRASRDV